MSQPIRARLERRCTITGDVTEICLALVRPGRLQFQAGQSVSLTVGVDDSGRDLRRHFSIASPSDQGQSLRFLVRTLSGSRTATFWNDLPLGHELEMTGPEGSFVLDGAHQGDVLFAATGTGLAPVLPMLGELATRSEPGQRRLYWGVRSENDLGLLDEVSAACAAADVDLRVYLSQPALSWRGPRGRINSAIIESVPQLVEPTIYLVGHGAMIAELKRALIDAGLDAKKHIRTEAFFD